MFDVSMVGGGEVTPEARLEDLRFKQYGQREVGFKKATLEALKSRGYTKLADFAGKSRSDISCIMFESKEIQKALSACEHAKVPVKRPPVRTEMMVPYELAETVADIAALMQKPPFDVWTQVVAEVLGEAIIERLSTLRKELLLKEAEKLRKKAAELEAKAA